MSAIGRLLLYVMTRVEGPVLAAKQLYARGYFQGSDMPESARRRNLALANNADLTKMDIVTLLIN